MALGIIEIGAFGAGAAGALILAPKNPPPHVALAQPAGVSKPSSPSRVTTPCPCTVLGAGPNVLTVDQVMALVLQQTGSKQLQTSTGNLGTGFRNSLRQGIEDEQVYQSLGKSTWITTPAGFRIIVSTDCGSTTQPPGAILHTVLPAGSQAIEGLSSLDAIPAGAAGDTQAGIGAAGGLANIVMGFQQGITAGLSATFTTVAQFDPEPITRAILQVVGSVFGAIFKHHQQRVRIEHTVECAATPSVNESLASIEAAVISGHVLPEHGCALLDDLYNSYKAHLQQYGLIGKGSSSWSCNAGCELLWYLTGIISRKKDRYLHLTNVPCPPPPQSSLFARPQTFVLASSVASRELSIDGHQGGTYV